MGVVGQDGTFPTMRLARLSARVYSNDPSGSGMVHASGFIRGEMPRGLMIDGSQQHISPFQDDTGQRSVPPVWLGLSLAVKKPSPRFAMSA